MLRCARRYFTMSVAKAPALDPGVLLTKKYEPGVVNNLD
jgi:hypothetical protein